MICFVTYHNRLKFMSFELMAVFIDSIFSTGRLMRYYGENYNFYLSQTKHGYWTSIKGNVERIPYKDCIKFSVNYDCQLWTYERNRSCFNMISKQCMSV